MWCSEVRSLATTPSFTRVEARALQFCFLVTSPQKRTLVVSRPWDFRIRNHFLYQFELELIQPHMAQKPVLRGEVGFCIS